MVRRKAHRSARPRWRHATLAGMLTLLLLASATFAAPHLSAGKDKTDKKDKAQQSKILKGLPITELSEDEAILHALNRLAFGPRPGDVETVLRDGVDAWINRQLRPDAAPHHPRWLGTRAGSGSADGYDRARRA